MSEAPTGRGAEGLWKTIALLLLSFLLCAAFMSLPAGAKLTGEYAILQKVEALEEQVRREREERIRLQTSHDSLAQILYEKLSILDGMAKDVSWQTKWLQAAGRK